MLGSRGAAQRARQHRGHRDPTEDEGGGPPGGRPGQPAPAVGPAAVPGALLLEWGLAYGGVSVSAQRALSAAAPAAPEAVSALFAGVFNAAIALGAPAGGRPADGPGPAAVLVTGALLAPLAAAVDTAGAATRP
ncbi:hypothetical protein [Streptomyces sp. NPDC018347]|uniref:hypothetical protein n=1 Tax=Streptomyces sp. NPDC018347 TaxID=3157193 RepID=UPI0033F961B1